MTDANAFRWTAALILFGTLFLGVSDTQLIGPLLPFITSDLDISAAWAGSLVTGYAVSAALFALILGTASDRYGRKRLLGFALTGFAGASLLTFQTSYLITLLLARMLTGLSAGALSTLALSYAADLYPYSRRGKAMGIVSMGYFLAFVVSVPLASLVTGELGWRWVFLGLALGSGIMLFLTVRLLPGDAARRPLSRPAAWREHFLALDRAAGIAAAFLTSGGLSAFLTYVGLWLASLGVDGERIFLPYVVAGVLATIGSLYSGWLADRIGKRPVLIGANLALAPLFVIVAATGWGWALFLWVGVLGLSAGARQAPLHALTTELVPPETRGSYVALRNAASQLGIATAVSVAAVAFARAGFSAVGWLAAGTTILIVPVSMLIREPSEPGPRPPDAA